jgi:uncharacterized protein (TIGR02145 family)
MKLSWKFGGKEMIQTIITYYDGNVYTEVVVGTQTWLVENLKATHDKNGVAIPYVSSGNLPTSAAYTYYNRDITNKDKYGCLYNRSCTSLDFIDGYRNPSKADFDILKNYVGNSSNPLKATGSTYWNSDNGLDTYGFDLRGAGRWTGSFNNLKGTCWFWETDNSNASYFEDDGDVGDYNMYDNTYGFSIRLIKE